MPASYRVINAINYITDEATAHMTAVGCEVSFRDLMSMSEDELCDTVRGADAVVAAIEPWTESVFGAADKVKIVARAGAGYDAVDLEAATRHGVWVTSAADSTSNAVADMTLILILCLLRHIPRLVNDMKVGVWHKILGKELGSMTLGMVGTGYIGRQVIKRVRAFGSKVLAYDIAPNESLAAEYDVQYVGFEELLAKSDIVSLHCALNDQTRSLMNKQTLKLMKPTAYLVNTSRPGVVVKEDLVAALRSKQIAGAAIDVHDPMGSIPEGPNDPLIELDNVIATPWNADYTDVSCDTMVMMAAEEVVRVLSGDPPLHPLNRIR